jgi:PAS domain S-box-containing protein
MAEASLDIQQQLRESEQKYAAIFRNSPSAIALARLPEGVYVDANDAFLRMFGLVREEIIGKTGVTLGTTTPDEQAQIRAAIHASAELRDYECTRTTRSGTRIVLSLNINHVEIGGVPHVLTAAIDITERKESEARQRRLTEELAELNRDLERRVAERTEELQRARALAEAASAAKTEFLSSMSHELRTPLNAILGFTQLLDRDRKSPPDERQRERLRHVLRGGEHLLRLVEDVLDLSRIEAGRLTISPEAVGVRGVLEEVIDTLGSMAASAEIAIEPPAPLELPPVMADRTRLAQILMNLGSNAIKYGRRGGHVVFELARPDPAAVRLTVIDDGIGIPADKRDKVFEPFQRAGQETGPIQGTGIGLTITKRLVEMMEGRIGFSSEVGRGSQFWIELPVFRARTAEPPRAVAPAAISPLAAGEARHKIVYVEDTPSNIAFMEDLLADLPSVALLTAPSAELGLELIRAHRPDAVIMDINLPGMSGFDAVRRLREWPETRDIPVIGLSAAALPPDTSRAAEAGFVCYLTKPVKVDELTRALEELLERGPA